MLFFCNCFLLSEVCLYSLVSLSYWYALLIVSTFDEVLPASTVTHWLRAIPTLLFCVPELVSQQPHVWFQCNLMERFNLVQTNMWTHVAVWIMILWTEILRISGVIINLNNQMFINVCVFKVWTSPEHHWIGGELFSHRLKASRDFVISYTLRRISNWPPSFYHILGKVFGEK